MARSNYYIRERMAINKAITNYKFSLYNLAKGRVISCQYQSE